MVFTERWASEVRIRGRRRVRLRGGWEEMSSFWLRCSGVLAAAVTAMDDKSRVLRVIFFLNFTEVIEDQPGLLIKFEGSAQQTRR